MYLSLIFISLWSEQTNLFISLTPDFNFKLILPFLPKMIILCMIFWFLDLSNLLRFFWAFFYFELQGTNIFLWLFEQDMILDLIIFCNSKPIPNPSQLLMQYRDIILQPDNLPLIEINIIDSNFNSAVITHIKYYINKHYL